MRAPAAAQEAYVYEQSLSISPQAQPESAAEQMSLLPDASELQDADAAEIYLKPHELLDGPDALNALSRSFREKEVENIRSSTVTNALIDNPKLNERWTAASVARGAAWPMAKIDLSYLNSVPPVQLSCLKISLLLAIKIRVHSAEHDQKKTIQAVRAGFALARHLERVPAQRVAARRAHGHLYDTLADAIQQDTPSLYAGLSDLVASRQNWLADAMKANARLLDKAQANTFPWLERVERAGGSSEQWNSRLREYADGILETVPRHRQPLTPASIDQHVVLGYRPAKAALVATGKDSQWVETMPVAQVLLLDALESRTKRQENVRQWFGHPFPIAYRELKRIESKTDSIDGFGMRKISNHMPAVPSEYLASVANSEQHLCMLCVVEALRIALDRNGTLPQSLSELNEFAPCPLDPATGMPFEYDLGPKSATLTGGVIGRTKRQWQIHADGSDP